MKHPRAFAARLVLGVLVPLLDCMRSLAPVYGVALTAAEADALALASRTLRRVDTAIAEATEGE